MRRYYILFSLLFIFTLLVNANSFRYLQPKDGLSSGEINHIVEDHEGRIWMATWTGLVRYDGYEFTNFRPILEDPFSLPDKKIKQLLIDNNGNLWIATEKNLVRMDIKTFRFETFNFDRAQNEPINILYINQLSDYIIVHAVEGFYIVHQSQPALADYKISLIDVFNSNNEKVFYYINHTRSVSHQDMLGASNASDIQSSLIFILRLEQTNKELLLRMSHLQRVKGAIAGISQGADPSLAYLASSAGAYQYHIGKNQTDKRLLFEGKKLNIVLNTFDNKVYAAGDAPELFFHDLNTNQTGSYIANPNRLGTLLNNKALSLFQDFSGNLWVGHQGQGISILNITRKAFFTIRHDPLIPSSLSSNAVMCFSSNHQHLLVGCRTGGINITKINDIENPQVQFDLVETAQGKAISGIWDIARQNDSLFWVGHNSGLLKLVLGKSEWKTISLGNDVVFDDTFRKILIDKYNNLWCGTMKNGLIFIPNPSKNPTLKYYQYKYDKDIPSSLSDNVVIDIMIDTQQRLWVGTGNGLNLAIGIPDDWDFSGTAKPAIKFKRYMGRRSPGNSLNNNEINCIFVNSDHSLWVATQGGGINILNVETEKFTYLTKDDGLPGNDIMGIVADKHNNLWISTEKGLAFYDQQSESPTFTNYSTSDGLQSDVFLINALHKSDNGQLFFGGENGFTSFSPKKIVLNTIKPNTIFTHLKIFNQIINTGDTIAKGFVLHNTLNETSNLLLPFGKNTFSVGVAALHYQLPEGNKIAYLLEGHDNQWHTISASQQFINFTKLPFGEYRLKVYAISSDNIPDDEIKTLSIKIMPPWYRGKYMIALYLIIGLVTVTTIVLLLVNRQKQLYQQRLYDMTLENNESKMMFLANIAHELRTPISLIVSPIEDMIINKSELGIKWHNHIYLMHRNANYIMKLINQIIDFRKLDAGKLKLNMHNDDIVRLINDVSVNFKAFETRDNIKLVLQLPTEPIIVCIDSQMIEEVLYNLLSNAFKHTPKEHNIFLSLNIEGINNELRHDQTDQFLKITVFNEGETIPEADQERIFERFYKANESAEGAGIGLSFAKSLVEMHQGKIWLECAEGRGVMFHVLLPYVKADTIDIDVQDGEMFKEKKPVDRSDIMRYDGGTDNILPEKLTKILIVEDNEDLRKFLVDILSRTYTCYEAKNGEVGLKLALEIVPDIIIADVIMPKLDGYELVQKLKEEIRTCHIPVIMLTGKNTNEHIISGYKSGADAYITKPFDTNVLLSHIARLIKNRELIHQKYKQQNFMVEISTQNLTRDDVFLKKVKLLLDKNIDNPDFNVKELSVDLKMSTTQLYRKIKGLTNYSPVEFLRISRLHKAHDLLIQKNYSIKEVSFLTGFNNLSYFVKCFREYFGVTPASFRDKMWPIE